MTGRHTQNYVGPPQWAVPLLHTVQSIHRQLEQVQEKQEILVSLADNVAATVTRVEDVVTLAVQILKDLAAKSANTGSVPDADVQAALDRINTAVQGLSDEGAADDPGFTPAPAPTA